MLSVNWAKKKTGGGGEEHQAQEHEEANKVKQKAASSGAFSAKSVLLSHVRNQGVSL